MDKSFIEDEDGFVKPANKEPSRASQVDQPSLGPGASVKDIAKNIQLPIMGMGNRNQMLLEKKKKEEEERRRRAQEEEEEYERQKEEQARDRALRASNVSQQQVIAQAEPQSPMEDPQNTSNASAFNNNAMMSKPVMAKKPNVKKMAFEDSEEEESKPISPPVIRQPPPPVSQPPPK